MTPTGPGADIRAGLTERLLLPFPESRRRSAAHSPLGRQPIVAADGSVLAYEFLYRSPTEEDVRVDRWGAAQQDLATRAVLESVFGGPGVDDVAGAHLAFVNVTRSYVVGERPLPDDPARLVLEVVESVPADQAVLAGVARLRAQGYRIAIDDFVALPAQCALLPFADYVKIDHRDLVRLGQPLLELAGSCGARLVAERIETVDAFDECVQAGFTLFQGDVVAPTEVLRRGAVVPSPRAG